MDYSQRFHQTELVYNIFCMGDSKFDPSIVHSKKKKKKSRPSSVPVVMLKNFSRAIPKGRFREKLVSQGRIQTLRVQREMSSSEIRSKITKVFDVVDYTVLECDGSGHGLLKSAEQDADGEYVALRSSLYLCEQFKVMAIMLVYKESYPVFSDRDKMIK